MINVKNLSLYIHIPFCERKCDYCDFLSAPVNEETREAYIQALLMEIESYKGHALSERKTTSVFIGGGTPSVLNENQITCVMKKIKEVFLIDDECEITIEINPGTVTKEKCECYFKNGINRVSIGLQSPDDDLLKTLGRIHTYEQFLQTYRYVREVGFKNVNIDLMSGLPGQSVEQYRAGIEKVVKLAPEHISAYSLILEEGTPFYDRYVTDKNGQKDIPTEEEDRQMYDDTKRQLHEYGYERYEISNYAKKGYECKHNIVYWKRDDYLGLGLGSASLIDECRYKNVCDLKRYIDTGMSAKRQSECDTTDKKTDDMLWVDSKETETLSVQMQMEEFLFLGLRMITGVSYRRFHEKFGRSIESVYGKQIEQLVAQNLLTVKTKPKKLISEEECFLALTDYGIDVSNYVFEQFLF